MEISFTRFRVYLECPWKYKLMFVDGKKIPLDPPSSLGVSLHRALERYHRGGGGDLDRLLECLEEEWLRGGYPDAETREKFLAKGRRILEKYYQDETSRRSEILGSEREFVYPLGRHTVRGMVDRIDRLPDGRVELIDYKTRLDFEKEGPIESDLQLRFYALGVRESLALEPSLLTVHYLAAGQRESLPYAPSGEEALKAKVLEVADAIERGKFAPDTSFCPRCGFRWICSYSVIREP